MRRSSVLLTCLFLLVTFSGPLLWHFENNNTNDPSIELDLEEVKALVREMGFRLSVRLFFTRGRTGSIDLIIDRTSGRSRRVIRAMTSLCSDIFTRLRFGKRPRTPSPLSSSCRSDHDADRPHVYMTKALSVSSCERTFHMQGGTRFPPKQKITAIGQASPFCDSGLLFTCICPRERF